MSWGCPRRGMGDGGQRQVPVAAPAWCGHGQCFTSMGVVPNPSTRQGAAVISSRMRVSRERPRPPKEPSTSANSWMPKTKAGKAQGVKEVCECV